MIDIKTDPIKHFPIKTGFEILTPASPNINCFHIKAPYCKTWKDKNCFEKSCFQVLPDLLTKKTKYKLIHGTQLFIANWKFAENEQRPGNLKIQ